MRLKDTALKIKELKEKVSSVENSANFLISCGLDKEARRVRSELTGLRADIVEHEKAFDDMQSKSKGLMFQMFMAIDIAYCKAIEFESYWSSIGDYEDEIAKNVKYLRDCFKEIVSGIDDYGMMNLSDEYAKCTDELDELYKERIEPLIEDIYARHKDKMIGAYNSAERRKERKGI